MRKVFSLLAACVLIIIMASSSFADINYYPDGLDGSNRFGYASVSDPRPDSLLLKQQTDPQITLLNSMDPEQQALPEGLFRSKIIRQFTEEDVLCRNAYYYNCFGDLVRVDQVDDDNDAYNTTEKITNTYSGTRLTGKIINKKNENPGRFAYSYKYDTAGRIIAHTGRNDDWVSYTEKFVYNRQGQLADYQVKSIVNDFDDWSHVIGTHEDTGGSRSYQYDKNGRLAEMKFTDGATVRFQFDEKGRWISQTGQHWNSDGNYGEYDPGYYDQWKYDSRGRITEHRERGQWGDSVVKYEYDGDRLVKVSGNGGDTIVYSYDEHGKLSRSMGNNAENVYYYNEAGQLASVERTLGEYRSERVDYEYDPNGLLIRKESEEETAEYEYSDMVFHDVQEFDYFGDAVKWALDKEITRGTSAVAFSPDHSCTRGQAVTFLWRAGGCEKVTDVENPFRDVKEQDYFYDAVLWALKNNITNGMTKTSFGPDAQCSRGQIVTFLWRAEGMPAATASIAFSDVAENKYYSVPVQWAVESKVTNGTSETAFSPAAPCTRGQIVTFLFRIWGDNEQKG